MCTLCDVRPACAVCALQVGVLLPSSQAEVAEAVAQSAGSGVSGLASLLQQTLPADADPSLVLAQLQQASKAPLPLAPRARGLQQGAGEGRGHAGGSESSVRRG
jgi:hypothetical protein